MIKRAFLLVYLIYAYSSSFSQTVKLRIDSLATIDFQAKPNFSDTMNNKVYSLAIGSERYIVSVRDISNVPNLHIKEDELPDFYTSIIDGIVDAAQGKIIAKTNIVVSNLKAAEVEFTSNSNPRLPDLRFSRVLIVNNKLIIYAFWTVSANEEATSIRRNDFLNSIRFLLTNSAYKQSIN